jgi:hypothetical protein
VTSTGPIAVVGLRGRYNERGDFLITTTPPVTDAQRLATEWAFPHLVSGGGWSTQVVPFGAGPGQAASGQLRVLAQSGETFAGPLR